MATNNQTVSAQSGQSWGLWLRVLLFLAVIILVASLIIRLYNYTSSTTTPAATQPEQSSNTSFPVAQSAGTQTIRVPVRPGEITKWYTMPSGSSGVINMERNGACITILKNGDASQGSVMCQGLPIPYEERRTVAFLNHTSKDEVVLLPNQ